MLNVRFLLTLAASALPLLVIGQDVIGQDKEKPAKPTSSAPSFDGFRVPAPLPPRKDRADIPTPGRVPNWEKELPKVAKVGPDFAGYYAVAQWSCGSLCAGFGILDVRNAKLHQSSFNVAYMCPDYGPGSAVFEYRVDSRLLIVNGSIETYEGNAQHNGPCGRFYYEWDGETLKPLRPTNSKPPR